MVKIRAKQKKFWVQNIKFYELQMVLTSFTLCKFYYLASGELKPRTKQSECAYISTTTWLWKTYIWSYIIIIF